MSVIRERLAATSLDGTTISFVRSGAGSPVLLVHGGGADASSLVLVARELAARFTVLLMDRRGRADPIDPDRYSVEHEYEDVIAVAEAAGAPVVAFAHSYGGLCTLGAATARPELFRALVLYEPPVPTQGQPIASRDAIARVDHALDAGDREAAVTTFLREVVKLSEGEIDAWRETPGWHDALGHAHVLRCEGRGVNEYRIDERATTRVTMPVTLILGSASHPQYAAAGNALRRTLPFVETVVGDGHGHLATASAPQALAAAVIAADASATGHAAPSGVES